MKKFILYEETNGCLHTCFYGGLDQEGHAKWIILEPGFAPMTLEDYKSEMWIEERNFLLLCEEGEAAPSSEIVKILGASIKDSHLNPTAKLNLKIKALKKSGIAWNEEPAELALFIAEGVKYPLSMSICDSNGCAIFQKDECISMREVVKFTKALITTIRTSAHIPISCSRTYICHAIFDKLSTSDKQLYDSIENL